MSLKPRIVDYLYYSISLILFFVGCNPSSPIKPLDHWKGTPRPNVFWIVIDSLRADIIGKYGITPELDALEKSAYVFTNHLVNAAWTRPSTLVFFTGKYASLNPVNFWDYPTPKTEVMSFYNKEPFPLPKYLSQNGVYTVMVGNNPFLTDKTGLGVDVGFQDLFDFSDLSNDTPSITKKSLSLIDTLAEKNQKGDPFFFFLNYNDPHKPYTPPHGYTERIKTLEILDDRKRDYIGEVAYIDDQIHFLFEKLKKKGLWENTTIIITADHGEVMNINHAISPFTGTNTYYGHGQDLFLENIHVPLIVKLPYQKVGKRFQSRSQSVDIYPFLLEQYHLSPKSKLDGISLTKIIDGKGDSDRLYYGETRATQGIGKHNSFLLQKSFRFHELGKFWEGVVGKELFYYYDILSDPNQISPIRFTELQEIKKMNIEKDVREKIISLWNDLRNIEPSIPVYTIRFNHILKKDGILEAKVSIPVGQIRIKKKAAGSKVFVSISKHEAIFRLALEKLTPSDKAEEISFEVYPDVVFPVFKFSSNERDVSKSSVGVGIFDLMVGSCKNSCEELYDAPLGSPRFSNFNLFQVWQSGGSVQEYRRDTRLEADAMGILKKQGYVQ